MASKSYGFAMRSSTVAVLLAFLGVAAPAWSLDLNDIQAVYGTNSSSAVTSGYDSPRSKIYDADAPSPWLNAPVNPPDIGGAKEIKFVDIAVSPRQNRALLGMSLLTGSASYQELFLLKPDGTWEHPAGFIMALPTSTSPTRQKIAVAYEQRSGNGLIVYRDPSPNSPNNGHLRLRYRRVLNGVLQPELPLLLDVANPSSFFEAPSSIATIQLLPRPKSNQILLIVNDSSEDLYTLLWDPVLSQPWNLMNGDRLTTAATNGAFDAAYIADGRLLIVYKTSGSKLVYRTCPANQTSWSGENTLFGAILFDGTDVNNVSVGSNPDGMQVAVGVFTRGVIGPQSQTNTLVYAMVWDWNKGGSACTSNCWITVGGAGDPDPMIKLIDATPAPGTPDAKAWQYIEVGWAGTGANREAVLVYTDAAASSQGLDWAKWRVNDQAAGWVLQSDALSTSLNAEEEVGLHSLSSYTGTDLLVLIAEQSRVLWAARYDPTNVATPWTVPQTAGSSLALTASLPNSGTGGDMEGRPFAGAINRYKPPTLTTQPLDAATIQYVAAEGGVAYTLAGSGTPAQQLRITDGGGFILGAPAQGTAKDLALTVPVGLTATWDQTMTVCAQDPNGRFTVGTAADGSGTCAAGFVKVKRIFPAAKTVKLDVAQDFDIGYSVILTGLRVIQDATPAAAAAQKLQLDLSGYGDTNQDDAKSIQLTEALQVAEHASGQAPNPLTPGNVTGVELFRFKMTPVGGTITLTQVTFDTTFAGGMTSAQIPQANLQLLKDGVPVAATFLVNANSIAVSNIGAVTGAANFTLTGNVNGLLGGHGMTLSLATAPTKIKYNGVIADGQSVPNALRGSVADVTHTVSTYQVTAPAAGATLKVGDLMDVTWQSFGSADPSNVKVEYKTHALGWTLLTCGAGSGAGVCKTTVPNAATTQAQIRLTDNTDPMISSPITPPSFFTITVGYSALTPTGGATWIVGRDEQVQWTQVGDATTEVALSINGGSYAVIQSSPVSAATPTNQSVTYQPLAAQATTSAQVRVRDTEGGTTHAVTQLESAPFTIAFAFNTIQPNAGSKLVGQSLTITWQTLAAAGSISSVDIRGVRPDNSTFVIATNASNSGSRAWTPAVAEEQMRIRVCQAGSATICAAGQPFDIVSLSVTTDAASYVLGHPASGIMHITWSGASALSQVKLWFVPSDGTPNVDILGGGTVAGASGQLDWTIPTSLGVPKPGIVRVEDANNATTGGTSGAVMLHGALQLTAPTAIDRWMVGTAQNITWTGQGQMTVKLEWAAQAAGPFTLLANNVASVPGDNTQPWIPLAAARSSNAVIRITDVNDATVTMTSPALHIIGQLSVTQPAGGNFSIDTPTPIGLQWTTGPAGVVISPVRLRVLDQSNAVVFEAPSVNSPGSPTLYDWTPTTTGKDLRLEVCDTADVTVCGLSGTPFSVSGISVSTNQSLYTLTSGGIPVTVQWRPVGISGSFRAYYQVETTGPLVQIPDGATTYTSPEDVTNTSAWNVPPGFTDLSDQLRIVVKDVGDSIQGVSTPFTIRGVLAFTSPAGGTYSVTDPLTIQWNTIGQIPSVNLGWSTNDCATQTAIPVGANTPNGSTSVAWTIPVAAVSNNLRFCLADATPGHAPTTAISAPIIVGAKLLFQGLPAGANWAVGTAHDLTWTTVGSIGQVLIEYGQELSPGVFTPLGVVNGGPLGDSGSGTTTVSWNVSDVPSLVGDPQVNWTVPFKLRVKDATAGHPEVPAVSTETLNAHYYHVEWVIKNENGTTISDGISVVDSSGWTMPNDSWNPGIDPFDGQLRRYHFYKAGTYTTQASKTNYQPGELRDWVADGHKTLTIVMISDVGATIPIRVNTGYRYDSTSHQVTINSWLEERGQLQSNPVILGPGPATIEIYNGPTLLMTLSDASADAAGQYSFTWDASAVPVGIYFARAKIERVGNPVTSGGAFNIELVSAGSGGSGSSGVTLTELQTELQPIKTDLVDVETAVTTTLPGQINTVGAAIQGDIATVSGKVDAVQADTGALKLDTAAILSDTATLKTDTSQLITKVDGVQAYLADPDAGLPKVLSNQDAMQTQLKAQRRGGLLNRDMELEQGETATIRYRSVDDTVPPSITIFTPLGGTLAGPMLQVSSNLYEFSVNAAELGEYRVVVSEPASADSSGTVDSVTLTSVAPRATAQGTSSLATQLTNLSTQLSTVEANLDSHLTIIENAMATKVQVDSAITKVDQLLAKWGSLSAQDLQNQLTALGVQVGTIESEMAREATLQGAVASLANLETAVTNLSAQVGTPAQEASMQNALNLLATVQNDLASLAGQVGAPAQAAELTNALNQLLAAIQGIPGAIDYSARFDQIDGTLTALSTQVGDPAQRAALDAAIAKLDTVELNMAKEVSVQSALTALGTLQTNLGNLATQVGTPAQAAELANAVSQIIAEIQSIPGAADYAPQLTALQNSVDVMNAAMGTPSQAAALQAVANQVTAVENAIAALPGAVDYTAQLTALQSDLTTLMADVQDPAQAAALQSVSAQVTDVQNAIASLPGATDYTAQLQVIDAAIAEVKTQVAALPTTAAEGGDTASVLEQLEILKQSIESAEGSSAAVGLSQNAFNAANEAVKILQQLQTEVRANGGAGGPALLTQAGEQLKNVSQSVTVIPGKFTAEELSAQLKELAKRAQGVSTDKGYHFDSLYELSETQATDVKTVRNQVEELKALLEVQRSILERNLDQPVVKTWFEAR